MPNERKGEIYHGWGLASGVTSLAAINPDYPFNPRHFQSILTEIVIPNATGMQQGHSAKKERKLHFYASSGLFVAYLSTPMQSNTPVLPNIRSPLKSI